MITIKNKWFYDELGTSPRETMNLLDSYFIRITRRKAPWALKKKSPDFKIKRAVIAYLFFEWNFTECAKYLKVSVDAMRRYFFDFLRWVRWIKALPNYMFGVEIIDFKGNVYTVIDLNDKLT